MNLFKIFITASLIDNVVLMRFIALCPFIGMSTDEDKSIGMGLAVTFVTVLATCVTWPVYKFILAPMGLVFLQLLVFILIIASLVQLVDNCVFGSACGVLPEKIRTGTLQSHGYLPCLDHHQLCHSRCNPG